jgi:AcrR family transcriptional regulator
VFLSSPHLCYDGAVALDTDGPLTMTKGAQTRRAILDAAVARFGREGYRSASVADIARDAAVGGTVAYAYFPNKEALFLAAVDDDAAGVIHQGLAGAVTGPDTGDWRQKLFFALVEACEEHPLARRLLAGLEPDVTDRVLETPALNDLRRICAERLADEQRAGTARADIDPVITANGIVGILLALLMSVVQLGGAAASFYADDVTAVLRSAVEIAPPGRLRRPGAPGDQVDGSQINGE